MKTPSQFLKEDSINTYQSILSYLDTQKPSQIWSADLAKKFGATELVARSALKNRGYDHAYMSGRPVKTTGADNSPNFLFTLHVI